MRGIPIKTLELEKLKLKQPFAVDLSYDAKDAIWIVDFPELNLYGEGKDPTEAFEDFKTVLEEIYFSLKKDKDRLGPKMEEEWNLLQKIVQEK